MSRVVRSLHAAACDARTVFFLARRIRRFVTTSGARVDTARYSRPAADAEVKIGSNTSNGSSDEVLQRASSLVDIAAHLESLGASVRAAAPSRGAASPWSPDFVASVLERCGELRGSSSTASPFANVSNAIAHSGLPSDADYGLRVRPAIIHAMKRAAFRPNTRQYARILA
jgi:hypothetical protein